MKLEMDEELPRLEIHSAHLGDRYKYTSTTIILNKNQTEQVVMWLATALEAMEDSNE
jgi:hypothetical protein